MLKYVRRRSPGRRRVLSRMFLDDDGGNLFTLELFCGSQEQANRLAESFKAEPERIYNEVLSALLEHEEKD